MRTKFSQASRGSVGLPLSKTGKVATPQSFIIFEITSLNLQHAAVGKPCFVGPDAAIINVLFFLFCFLRRGWRGGEQVEQIAAEKGS
jgi:hypothetical protein